MEQPKLIVRPRSEIGKGPNRRLRASGRIPAIIYGTGKEPDQVSLEAHEFGIFVSTLAENTIYKIEVDNNGASTDAGAAVVREIQRDPVTRRILHVDFYRIRMDVENDFEIPVRGVGLAIGVKEGGILETHLHAIEVRCLPTLLPGHIDVDLSNLKVNHSVHVSDLQVPQGIAVLSDPEQVIFTVLPPKEETAPAAGEAEEVTQPEVITRKKAEEEA